MAVPKKKKSRSRTKMHRSHLALKGINLSVDKTTGNFKRPHHVSLEDGYYNEMQVIVKKPKATDDESEDSEN